MPFVKRAVEPVDLRRGALTSSDISLGEEHEVVVNKSFTQILLQLAQLSTHANEIFTELSKDCKGIMDKSQKLKARIWELDERCRNLNALDVPLPESSLEEVAVQVQDARPIQTEQETGFFTAVTRPECVQRLYNLADKTPRAVYAALGPPGYKAAKRFCLTPVLKQQEETIIKLPKYKRTKYHINTKRGDKLRQPRPRSSAAILEFKSVNPESHLPTPEETTLRAAKSQPSILVQIDTSESNFERFAQSRASLRNIRNRLSYTPGEENPSDLARADTRRQTISGVNDLKKGRMNSHISKFSLEVHSTQDSKPKNPDHYIEDKITTPPDRRSRSKEKKPSLLTKLVRRSRSLPRDMGRVKSKDLIVPPDYYDIHPQKSVVVQPGAMLNAKSEKVYTNFYGAPNTELPSPQIEGKLKKSKSDHQIVERSKQRAKSQSAIEESQSQPLGKNTRPRSVSAERSRSVLRDQSSQEHRRSNSLTRTLSSLFRRRSKVITAAQAHSRDSINTVFTSTSDGEATRRHSKRLSITNVTLRKRDSKATNSSSGRWSGSERYSMDSDGILSSALSQNRISRVSVDRDSALGVDIGERPTFDHEGTGTKVTALELCSHAKDETASLYSVDQDGFFTTMHTDSYLQQDNQSEHSINFDEDYRILASDSTSTKTLNSNGLSGNYTDSDGEEMSERLQSKINMNDNMNRYSLVMAISDQEESPEAPAKSTKLIRPIVRRTYETDLDQALDILSDIETSTLCSDTDSVLSVRIGRKQPVPPVRKQSLHKKQCRPPVPKESDKPKNTETTSQDNKALDTYKQLTGCDRYMRLNAEPNKEDPSVGNQKTNNSCHSLPRNFSTNKLSVAQIMYDDLSPSGMGSWPRKFGKSGACSFPKSATVASNVSRVAGINNAKRQSLSPNRTEKPERREIITSLIEEARSMSLTPESANPIQRSNCRRPWSAHGKLNIQTDDNSRISPYASISVVHDEPFRRQPSYRMACNEMNTPTKPEKLPPEELGRMQRAASYRKASRNSVINRSTSSHETMSPTSPTPPVIRMNFARAPSYRMAQSTSFDRSSRAPNCKKALRTNPIENKLVRECDSGLGLSSMGSSMTTSSGSNSSENSTADSAQRAASYRVATEDSLAGTRTQSAAPLPTGLIRECMKGVYANEETHLSSVLTVPSKLETVRIKMKTDSSHYSVPRTPALPTSFSSSTDDNALQKSKKPSGHTFTPPPRTSKKNRPMSSYMPAEPDKTSEVPENILQVRQRDFSAFTSMELLKSDEMAVLTVLDKVRRSTRPVSFIQSDV